MGPQCVAEIIQKVKDKLAQHHLKAVNYGVVGIPKDEAAREKSSSSPKNSAFTALPRSRSESIDTIEKLVKEFDVRVGFHDHPKRADNPNYKMWDPHYILSVVKDRDRRIGHARTRGIG
jgi:hypothetical protein